VKLTLGPTLRNFERSYHLSYWHWLNLNLHTEFIVYIWLNWFHDSVFIYIIVGEWYRSHICERSPYVRCISCTRRRVQSAELASLTTATNYFRPTRILYCIVWLSAVVSLYYIIVCRWTFLKLTTKSAISIHWTMWMCYFFSCWNIANVKLHLQHSKYIRMVWVRHPQGPRGLWN